MSNKIIDREYLVRTLSNYNDYALYIDKEIKIVDSPETFVVCDSTDEDAVLVGDDNLSYIQSYLDSVNIGDYVKHVNEISHTETKRVQKIANTLNAYFVRGRHDLILELVNNEGETLCSKTVSIPLESAIIGATYDNTNKSIIFELQNGDLEIPVGELVSGLIPDTRTIAGIDLIDDIEAAELRDALDLNIESITDDDIKSLFTSGTTPDSGNSSNPTDPQP